MVIDGSVRKPAQASGERWSVREDLKETMALKASEISDLIRKRIESFEAKAEARDVGTIIALTDGIARIHGLADVQYGEMIEFPGGSFGSR
jgi:cell division ATPase FtsA